MTLKEYTDTYTDWKNKNIYIKKSRLIGGVIFHVREDFTPPWSSEHIKLLLEKEIVNIRKYKDIIEIVLK